MESQYPMIALCIPISESKSYCFMDFARGVYELDYPKERLIIVFALDDFGASEVEKKIGKFIELWPYQDNCHVITTTLLGNDPKCTDIIPWQTRARFAAKLRNLYSHFVVDLLDDVEYIFSVGSDIVLEPNSLNQLLQVDNEIVSGLYISRIQMKPLALSFNDGSWSYDDVNLESYEPFKADWSGLDCTLIHRKVFEKINWDDFYVDKYGIGEDGYFYLEAKKNGYQLWINPRVAPLHIQEDGSAVSTNPVPSIGLTVTCSCGWSTKLGKRWKDITVKCPNCGDEMYVDPFWKPRDLDSSAIGAGIASDRIT